MGFGTISNTYINANGHSVRIHYNSLSPFGGCWGYSRFSPGCFGFGFNPVCVNPWAFGAGAGLGFAAGMMIPGVIEGVCKGAKWLWNKIF